MHQKIQASFLPLVFIPYVDIKIKIYIASLCVSGYQNVMVVGIVNVRDRSMHQRRRTYQRHP